MKRFFMSAAILCVAAAPLSAQVGLPPVVTDRIDCFGYDDGEADGCWKSNQPALDCDWFGVDFDNDLNGLTACGICIQICGTQPASFFDAVGCYPDNLNVDPTGFTPDVYNPVCEISQTTFMNGNGPLDCGASFCPDWRILDCPDYTISQNFHIAISWPTGDTGCWVCTDEDGNPDPNADQRSHATNNDYSTPASPVTGFNWMLRKLVNIKVGQVLFDGRLEQTVFENNDVVITSFLPTAGDASLTRLFFLGATQFQYVVNAGAVLNFSFNPPPINACDTAGVTQGPILCGFAIPGGTNLTLQGGGFYLDSINLKPNLKPSVQVHQTANLHLLENVPGCNPASCWGSRDDGARDFFIWSLRGGPEASRDYFSVSYGPVAGSGSPVTNVSAIQVASVEGCFANRAWQQAGVYAGLSSAGNNPLNTPDVNGIGGVLFTVVSAAIPANASDWGYPAQTYSAGNVAVVTTTPYHGVIQWVSGESCVWVSGDEDGAETFGCSDPNFTTSFLSANGYNTTIGPVGSVHWQIRADWN